MAEATVVRSGGPTRKRDAAAVAAMWGVISRKRQEQFESMVRQGGVKSIPTKWWAEVEKEYEDSLRSMLIIMLAVAASNLSGGGTPTDDRAVANATYAATRAKEAAQAMVQQARNSADDLGRRMADANKAAAAIARATGSQAVPMQVEITVVFDEKMAGDIAAYETVAAEGAAVEFTPHNYDKDIWLTTPDERVCKYCEALEGEPRDKWEAIAALHLFPPYLRVRIFRGPPIHPHCWCEVALDGTTRDGQVHHNTPRPG